MSDKKISARDYLKQLEILDMQINDDLAELHNMKLSACSTGGIDYSKDRVQSSTVGDKLYKDVVRYTMFEEQINKEIDEFFDAKNQIIREIRGLHDKRYIQVLTKIYVQFKSVKNAAQEMKLSYSYTIDLHKQALEAFEKTYDNLHYLT